MKKRLILPFVAIGLSAAVHAAPSTPEQVSVFKEGDAYVFRTDDGMPLYTFDKDGALKSNCSGQCADAWPPVQAPDDSRPVGDWKPIERDDGSWQWTFRKQPVYTFVKDEPGKPQGDGLGGVWHVVKP